MCVNFKFFLKNSFRCKEMPRKTQPEGRPKMHDINTEQKLRNEAFLHSNPPKGT